jgi:prepilin signal peptidase PulO-like enzyme (type II secretory pathway)
MTGAAIGLFIYVIGLCVGSFLNVVIYRLPRGLSILKPAWSFCPHCKTTLRWHDNLPVLSWLLLRARCRHCRQPISRQYPLIEAATGVVFLLVYCLLFVADARLGVAQPRWPTDVPLLLAWLVLVGVLIACSAMDLLWYVVDTRITDVAVVAGIVLCALWPRPEFFAARAATPAAAAAVVAFLVSALMLWWAGRGEPSAAEEELVRETTDDDAKRAVPSPMINAAAVLAIVVFVGLAVWLLVGAAGPALEAGGHFRLAVPAVLLALFAVMVLTGGQPREVDKELRAAIEAEAPTSRGAAVRESVWLAPATATAIITYFVVRDVPAAREAWQEVMGWMPFGRFAPLAGAAFAIHGAIIAAAAGWIIRIFFTLAFGREAFGVGDIYILAAAGAVGGWDIALLGFLLSVFIALLGWTIGLLLKRPGMIPFGPPLAIGFLMALWLNRPAAPRADALYEDFAHLWQTRPLLLLGIVLVVLPLSILLARLTRHLIEPHEEQVAPPPQSETSLEEQPGDEGPPPAAGAPPRPEPDDNV